jgi:restriction system protein
MGKREVDEFERLVRTGELPKGIDGLELIEIEMNPDIMSAMTVITSSKKGETLARIFITPGLKPEVRRTAIARELALLHDKPYFKGTANQQLKRFFRDLEAPINPKQSSKPTLSLSGVLIPDASVPHGVLIKSVSILWGSVVDQLRVDWDKAYEIPPEVWEEIFAGAFHRDGFDKVTLTPRSGDYGRDVIAIKSGVGCIKIIGSMKAYKPGHLVKHDDVRALLGVLSGEQDASKGIITTTSGFAPRITSDPFIKPFLPTRLELMDGVMLKDWLVGLKRP